MAADPTSELIQHLRRPDLSILGNAIRSLPPAQWQTRMFFMGMADKELKHHTNESFPRTLRKTQNTHPVFVLRQGTTGHQLCPCSSKGNLRKHRYITKGCQLDMTSQVMDRNSFLIEQYVFILPLDHCFQKRPFFFGRVPDCCIRDQRDMWT